MNVNQERLVKYIFACRGVSPTLEVLAGMQMARAVSSEPGARPCVEFRKSVKEQTAKFKAAVLRATLLGRLTDEYQYLDQIIEGLDCNRHGAGMTLMAAWRAGTVEKDYLDHGRAAYRRAAQ